MFELLISLVSSCRAYFQGHGTSTPKGVCPHDDGDLDSPPARKESQRGPGRISCRRDHRPIHPGPAGTLFGTEKIGFGDARVTIIDPERTLLDGLTMPEYCGDFAEVLHAFEARSADLDLERIIQYAQRLDESTVKRLGWVLERQGVSPRKLELLLKVPIKGYRKPDPTGPNSGPYNRRWMIRENLLERRRA
jgi:predicted transcriptional regulator of viral defense system